MPRLRESLILTTSNSLNLNLFITDLLEALGALHVERAVQVELVVELPDLVVLPRRLGPRKAAKRTRVLDYFYLSWFVRRPQIKQVKDRRTNTNRSIDRVSNRKHVRRKEPVLSPAGVRRHSFLQFAHAVICATTVIDATFILYPPGGAKSARVHAEMQDRSVGGRASHLRARPWHIHNAMQDARCDGNSL